MLAIAGKIAGPNKLTFFEGTGHGNHWVNMGNKKFHGQRRALQLAFIKKISFKFMRELKTCYKL